jgi:hypothetical protein
MTFLSLEQKAFAVTLIVSGCVGIPIGIVLESIDAWLVVLLFVVGAALSMLKRRYKGIETETLAELDEVRDGARFESTSRTLSGVVLVGSALVIFLLLVALVGTGAAPALGGLTAGVGLTELHLARLFARWEGSTSARLVYRTPRLLPTSRDALPDLSRRSVRAAVASRPTS